MPEACNTCGLPKEICVCEEIAREQQDIEITIKDKSVGKPKKVEYKMCGKPADRFICTKNWDGICYYNNYCKYKK